MTIFTYENLYRAYLECRRNKRKTINALKFELDFEKNLRKLLEDLKTRKYYPGRSICFAVKAPSLREIFAADFRDRIVHHLLVREISPFFERRFSCDSYACRPKKGTHAAVEQLKKYMKSFQKQKYYYGQFDLRGFFMSIDHNILYAILKEKLKKKFHCDRKKLAEILWLARLIIFHKPSENYTTKGDLKLLAQIPSHKSLLNQKESKGLPIGNHSSQFFANVYLDELDQFVKRNLKCRRYVRYVDDFVILEKSPAILKYLRNSMEKFIGEKLSLRLNFNKCRIQAIERGLDFLGYFLKPDKMYVRRRVIKRYRNKLYPIAIGLRKTNLRSLLSMASSYAGHFQRAR
jgi:retron-type reverse transcriptase